MLILRALAWLLLLVIVFVSLSPSALRPVSGSPVGLEHATLFALTSLVFSLGHAWRLIVCFLFLVFFAGLVEWAQMFVPGRHARFIDFSVKSLGIFIGLALAFFLRKWIQLPL
jgi:VanZ family protein